MTCQGTSWLQHEARWEAHAMTEGKREGREPNMRRVCVLIVAVAAASGCGRRRDGETAPGSKSRPAPVISASEALAKLTKAASGTTSSYNQLVRELSRSVTGCDLSGKWEENLAELREQGSIVLDEEGEGDLRLVRLLVLRGVSVPRGMESNDVFVVVGVGADGEGRIAEAGLSTEVNLPFAEMIKQAPFPIGSAALSAMDLAEIRDAAKAYPYVKHVAVSYGKISTRHEEAKKYGFRIEMELAKGRDGASSGKKIWSYAESGLDCPELPGGAPADPNHKSTDTITAARFGGSTEWTTRPDE